MRALLFLLVALLSSCSFLGLPGNAPPPPPDPRTVRTLVQAQLACEAKGQVLIARTDSCTEAQLRLDNLVRTDVDCLQYFGDAGTPTISCDPEN